MTYECVAMQTELVGDMCLTISHWGSRGERLAAGVPAEARRAAHLCGDERGSMSPRQSGRPRSVFVALTVEEARHTAAYLKASTCEMLPDLGEAWRQTPVGRAQAKIEAAASAFRAIADHFDPKESS